MSKFAKEMVDDYANKLYIGLTDAENKMVFDMFLKLCARHGIRVTILIPPFSEFSESIFRWSMWRKPEQLSGNIGRSMILKYWICTI